MKKLRLKVFVTIFLMFTLFLLLTLIFVNCDNYRRQKGKIRNNLLMIYNTNYKTFNKLNNQEYKDYIRKKLSRKIFMDYTIHTIILDDNNKVIDVVKHKDSTKTNEEILNTVSDILKSKLHDDEIIINNLYTNKYSYVIDARNFIAIINNKPARESIYSTLNISLIIFVISEIIMFFISKVLTGWIVKPALESFVKQKKFIEDASHELKTPLSIISASVDNLKKNNIRNNMIDNIEIETNRMNNLICSMLDLAKSERFIDKKTYLFNNISKLIKKRILVMESLAYENNVYLNDDIEEDINLLSDANMINQLTSILIDNAIKHSYKGKKIYISLKKEENNIIFKVKNYGKQIPKEDIENIFERFYRSDKSRNRDSNRYGLGLAIAKNIVDNHNGLISVESNEKTTTFKVIFKKTLKK